MPNVIQLRTDAQSFIEQWIKVRKIESPKKQIKAKALLMNRLDDYADRLILEKRKA